MCGRIVVVVIVCVCVKFDGESSDSNGDGTLIMWSIAIMDTGETHTQKVQKYAIERERV